ncbi:MAG: hydrogenase formation protein HypD [Candidatus Aureabacteria bacterium]|nr:hydrogenase formation protein HypD [Candidatus Auribacterota bacterium]
MRSLLPSTLRLVSGPGCPVCVTPVSYLDRLIAYARMPKIVIATFGDLVRVPGSRSSLRREKSRGADVRLIYSPLESLAFAGSEPLKKVILAAVGFETTTPAVAACAIEARARGLNNFFILSGGRMIPPAMDALLKGGSKIDGFLCPGHVSVVIGTRPYERIARIYKVPCVIAGFEPLDILLAVRELTEMIAAGKSGVKNLYPRAVEPWGNPKARRATEAVFRAKVAEWRGLGVMPRSGYFLRKEFQDFDAGRMLPVSVKPAGDNPLVRVSD